MNSIGVVGKGFVGTAVFEGMKHAFDVWAYDKERGWSCSLYDRKPFVPPILDPMVKMVSEVDGPIFVCVPTPMKLDGSCDTSIVESVIKDLDRAAGEIAAGGVDWPKPVVCIKSTIIPGTSARLNEDVNYIIVCFNPEFLTEANSIEDFKNQDRIIIGGPHEGTAVLKQAYQTAYPHVPLTKTHSTIAEMVKYVTNCFLATKVSFANEIKQICDGLDIDYDKVIEYATKDKRLGQSHWSVPGPDGVVGFNGKCFPKDLNSLVALAKNLGVDTKVMDGVWQKNLEVRPSRDWEKIPGVTS